MGSAPSILTPMLSPPSLNDKVIVKGKLSMFKGRDGDDLLSINCTDIELVKKRQDRGAEEALVEGGPSPFM